MLQAEAERPARWPVRLLSALQRRLYGPRAPVDVAFVSWRELCLTALLLAGLTLAVYHPHLQHGGLMSDDWSNLADYRFAPSPRYLETARIESGKLGGRPLLGPLLAAPPALFGEAASRWIALALGLAALASLLLYALLRAVDIPRIGAGAVSALILVFEPATATRLWPAAALNQVALILALAGVLLTLRALRAHGARASVLHVLGLALYAASIATYEIAGIVLLCLGPLYLRFASARIVAWRWSADIVVVGVGLAASATATREVRYVADMHARAADVPRFGYDVAAIFARTLTPFGVPEALAIVPVVIAAVAIIVRRPSREDLADPTVQRWAAGAAVAALLLTATLVPFLGSSLRPTSAGIDDRANLATAPAFIACALSFAGLAAALAAPVVWRRRAVSVTLGSVSLLLLAGGWHDARQSQRVWATAATEQGKVLAGLRDAIPAPTHGTAMYVYGRRTEVAPRVPVFDESWDLQGAVRLLYGDPTLDGIPLRSTTALRCDPGGVTPVDPERPDFEEDMGHPYRDAVAVDVVTARATPISDRATCRAIARTVDARTG